ncbi:SDR family NAD(P)-dependent oxidoreductase, partial [Novosphingobium sp.]|uniref:SDR family NAD(P)-dependent oxidoreductase n=1 Tax=Novosphingobium sp. TaxID=1874826 RepID=UPI0025ED9DAF
YSATKFGVRALTESLDAEWFQDGIKVADLMPGFIDTPLIDMAPNAGTNSGIREQVVAAGLEITPVSAVGDAAWAAVNGTALHTYVGKTARRGAFAARWMPGSMRRFNRKRVRPLAK